MSATDWKGIAKRSADSVGGLPWCKCDIDVVNLQFWVTVEQPVLVCWDSFGS